MFQRFVCRTILTRFRVLKAFQGCIVLLLIWLPGLIVTYEGVDSNITVCEHAVKKKHWPGNLM